MNKPLEGSVAVVTGASSGIGLAIARDLCRQGALVMLTARSVGRLQSVMAELPGPSRAVTADVTDPDAIGSVMEAAAKEFGPVDIVVANAGVYMANKFWLNNPADIESLISTNVTGVMRTVHAAITAMLPRSVGDIVVTNSVSGYQSIHWEPVYSASKHALRAFVEGVRRQLVGTGIRLGTIAPGVVHTELWSAVDQTTIDDQIGKTTGIRPEDVAEAVIFMLTRPRHVTIRDLVVLPSDQAI
ncbi:MAG: SDR family oxidoreductase [Acidimicrobiales bacterium]